ncbi:MFS transporter [Brucella grignonensis]|uniref:Transmembrane secretion effector family protein n=1 Tax=Brucella grignonensis TaxID=94627 RepID=A0A256FNC9_9HYPH|nr:MFS transporter [Brucella grignonensis]OYR16333.1 transmembrane secretion effector family protein [Brucella grignonensis]
MPQRNSPLAPFQYGTFRALWSATLFSNLGGLVQTVGAGWMMATIAHSDDMVALVQASTTLPVMIFSVAAGALADNFDRRRIMLTAQILLLVISVALAAFAYFGMLTPWMLLGFTFLIGCGGALHNPSWQASMGDIVPRADLPAAVALNSMSFNLMRSIGPAIGGAIVAAAGAAFAFIFNAFSYCALILALWRWQPQITKSSLPREALGPAMVAGLRYVAMSPNLLKVMFRGFLFGLSAIVILALLPLVARDLVKGTALTYGIMLGFFGIGAIGGALSSARLRELLGNEWLVRSAFVAFALSCLLLSVSRSIWMSCIFLLPAGLSWVLALSLFNVTVQLSTPRWVVGRALALYQTATFGGMAAGSWLWGSVADEFSVPGALLAAACVLLFGALVGFLLPQPEFESLNLDPLNRFSEPQLRLDLRSRSGPIMIMVDYKIAQEDVQAFLAAMTLRRRIRIRDGARQWALLRDLENPETWTESYHVPTWVEYVRHNQRRTQSDAEVSERLLALHKGTTPPLVHRMIERQTVSIHDDMPLKAHLDLT